MSRGLRMAPPSPPSPLRPHEPARLRAVPVFPLWAGSCPAWAGLPEEVADAPSVQAFEAGLDAGVGTG